MAAVRTDAEPRTDAELLGPFDAAKAIRAGLKMYKDVILPKLAPKTVPPAAPSAPMTKR